jgi:hypothetical protein
LIITTVNKFKIALRTGIIERHYPQLGDSVDEIVAIQLSGSKSGTKSARKKNPHVIGLNETTLVPRRGAAPPEVRVGSTDAAAELRFSWGECFGAGVKIHRTLKISIIGEQLRAFFRPEFQSVNDLTYDHWRLVGGWNNLTSVIGNKRNAKYGQLLKNSTLSNYRTPDVGSRSVNAGQVLNLLSQAGMLWINKSENFNDEANTAARQLALVLAKIENYKLSELTSLRSELVNNIGLGLRSGGVAKQDLQPIRNLALRFQGHDKIKETEPGLFSAIANWIETFSPHGDDPNRYDLENLIDENGDWDSNETCWLLVGAFFYGFMAGNDGIYPKKYVYEYQSLKHWVLGLSEL